MYKITLKKFIEQLLETTHYCSYELLEKEEELLESYVYDDLDDCSPLFLAKDRLDSMLNQNLINAKELDILSDFGKKLMVIFASNLPRNAQTICESKEWQEIFDLGAKVKTILEEALKIIAQGD